MVITKARNRTVLESRLVHELPQPRVLFVELLEQPTPNMISQESNHLKARRFQGLNKIIRATAPADALNSLRVPAQTRKRSQKRSLPRPLV